MKLYKNFTPAVSIILPTYNRAGLIGRALNSVINQSFTGWECLVVDDGSSDNTFEIVNKLLVDERFRYMKHKNKKLPISLNTGIQASAGEYITFLGSDDEYKPEHLQLRYDFMVNHRDVDLIQGGVDIIGHPYVKDKNDLSKKIHLSECVIGGTFFGKRDVFFELNGFKDIFYSEDSEFWERAAGKFNTVSVDFPTYIYHRDTPDSICNLLE